MNLKRLLLLVALTVLMLSGTTMGESCTLSFKEIDSRDAWAPYKGNLDLEVLEDGRVLDSFDVVAAKGLQEKEIELRKGIGSAISLRIAYTSGTRYTVLVYDLEIDCDGRSVKYSPWITESGRGDTDAYGILYNDGKMAFVFPRYGDIDSGDFVQFTSSPMEASPEIEVSAKDVEVVSSTSDLKSGDNIELEVKVRNTGGLEGKADLEFLVNGNLKEKVSNLFIPADRAETHTFSATYNGKTTEIEIRALSERDGRKDNNNAIVYLVDHPYLFFRNIKKTPAYTYRDDEPYRSWIKSVVDGAGRLKDKDHTNTKTLEICQNARSLALAYQLTGTDDYANAAVEALSHVGERGWSSQPSTPNEWANAAKILWECGESYDWLHEYIISRRPHKDEILRGKLASMEQDVYLFIRDMMEYDQGESKPRVFGDPGTSRVRTLSGFGVMALALIDYNGEHAPEGGAAEWLEFAVTDLLENSTIGGDKSTLETIVASGGHFGEVGYNHYFVGFLAPFLAAYKSTMGENLADRFPIVEGFIRDPIAIMLPDGQYPNEVSSWMGLFNDQYYSTFLAEEEDRRFHQWYLNNVLGTKNCFAGCTQGSVEGFRIYNFNLEFPLEKVVLYDKSLEEEEPSFNGDPSYFNFDNGEAVFRSGWGKEDALYLYLKAPHQPTIGGHGAADARQGSYELYALGDYLLIDSGDNRYWPGGPGGWEVGAGFSGAGHNSVLVDDQPISNRKTSTSSYMRNKAYLTKSLASEVLDYSEVVINITHLKHEETEISDPVLWKRSVLFPSNEYFIVIDKLDSDGIHDYDLLLHYGSLKGDTGKPNTHEDNVVVGELELEGKGVDWR
ncbi:heparinase II/III family protein, partial [Candidatus Altiarchaeota archaeon]